MNLVEISRLTTATPPRVQASLQLPAASPDTTVLTLSNSTDDSVSLQLSPSQHFSGGQGRLVLAVLHSAENSYSLHPSAFQAVSR